jgi:hypothetical protein
MFLKGTMDSIIIIIIIITIYNWLRWFRGIMLAFIAQVRGFKPGRNRPIFKGEKSPERLPSEGSKAVGPMS